MIVGGDVLAPSVIEASKIKPLYPLAARTARREGSVVLQATILADGAVGEVLVLRVEPPGYGFEQSAIDAVRQWRFEPATMGGRSVAVYFTLQVRFDLN